MFLAIGGAYGYSDGDGNTYDVTSGSATISRAGGTAAVPTVGQWITGTAMRFALPGGVSGIAASRLPYCVVESSGTTFKVAHEPGGTPLVANSSSGGPSFDTIGYAFLLPDLRGRVGAGRDDMGGSAASRLTAVTGGFGDATLLGAAWGSQNHTLTGAQSGLPQHAHSYNDSTPFFYTARATGSLNTAISSSTPSKNTDNAGPTDASEAHPNCQPTLICNHIIRIE